MRERAREMIETKLTSISGPIQTIQAKSQKMKNPGTHEDNHTKQNTEMRAHDGTGWGSEVDKMNWQHMSRGEYKGGDIYTKKGKTMRHRCNTSG